VAPILSYPAANYVFTYIVRSEFLSYHAVYENPPNDDSTETPTEIEGGSGDIDAVTVESPLAGDEPAQFFRVKVTQG
jgi:hypothetical protein